MYRVVAKYTKMTNNRLLYCICVKKLCDFSSRFHPSDQTKYRYVAIIYNEYVSRVVICGEPGEIIHRKFIWHVVVRGVRIPRREQSGRHFFNRYKKKITVIFRLTRLSFAPISFPTNRRRQRNVFPGL